MPQSTEPFALTASEALSLIEKGDLSALDWVLSCQERIRDREPQVLAWTSFNEQVIDEVTAHLNQADAEAIADYLLSLP